MDKTEIIITVRNIVLEIVANDMDLPIDEVELSDNDSLIEEGFVDSLNIIRLIECCQSEFDLEIHPEEISIEYWDSMNKIAGFVEMKLNGSE